MSSPTGAGERRPRRTSPESDTSESTGPDLNRPQHSTAEPYPADYSTAERSPADTPTEATPVYDATQTRRSDRPGVTGATADTHTRALNTTAADTPYAERDYTPDNEPDGRPDTARPDDPAFATREMAAARQREAFGGIKIGSAFFGWLAATGMAVLLTALVAAAGTAVGLATNTDVNAAVGRAASNQTVGIVGIIVLLVILFASYYSGGYVAGRMARFNGAKQGFMVWIWALIAAVLVAVLGMIAGERFNILAQLNSFPRIPVNEGQVTTTGIIAAVVVALVALVGAVLGGMAGMHFHRKVDRAGFTPTADYEER
ncbi:YrzE family protein [Arthrobacter sp. NPDC056691]|uniref:YrzE family protein n=1 Tax=Arthrobacter sp. NPDC056691 TaxID=3345913 RepID=UPI003672485D